MSTSYSLKLSSLRKRLGMEKRQTGMRVGGGSVSAVVE